jgi:hypothetical protein
VLARSDRSTLTGPLSASSGTSALVSCLATRIEAAMLVYEERGENREPSFQLARRLDLEGWKPHVGVPCRRRSLRHLAASVAGDPRNELKRFSSQADFSTTPPSLDGA